MELNTDLTTGATVGAAGAVLAAVATLLPWFGAEVEAGPADVNTATTGLETTGGLLVLLLTVAVLLVVFLADWSRRTALGVLAAGAAVLVVTLFRFAELGGVTGARVGLYLALVGGVVLLAGGGLGYGEAEEP